MSLDFRSLRSIQALVVECFLPCCLAMKNRVLNYLRHCPGCSKSLGSFDWLCLGCESQFYANLSLKTRWIHKNIKHHYLVGWGEGDGNSKLVYSLKGGGQKRVFQRLMPFFKGGAARGPIYFPSKGKRDHAVEIAESFGECWGCSIQPILGMDSKKQALLSRMGRQGRHFLEVSRAPNRVNLVDDIVTTGGTVMGCYRALGQPAKMTVWSLFYRKSL